MKAAVFHGSKEGLRIEDVPVPKIGPDQILVEVAACGVCHTDLHYIEHGVPTFKTPPGGTVKRRPRRRRTQTTRAGGTVKRLPRRRPSI